MTVEKVSYVPSQISFFEISKDQISQARKKVLLECFSEIKQILPGIDLAFALFGSLSKAKHLTPEVADVTDIDIKIYFDEMKLDKLLNLNLEIYSTLGLDKGRDMMGLWRNTSIKNWIENYIFQKMQDRPDTFLSDGDFVHTGYCPDGVEKLVKKVKKGVATNR
jgi:hypothetical protein